MTCLAVAIVSASAWATPFVDAASVSVGNHSLALPLGQLARFDPFYPAIDVLAEHHWVDHGAFVLAQDGRIGAFRHGFFGPSVTLGTDLVARLTAHVGPTAELGLGIGAIDSWRARPVLDWDEGAGTYAPAHDPGRLGITAGFSLGVGFDLGKVTKVPLTPAMLYHWYVQSPFLPALGIGPQGTIELGLRWTFGGAA